MTFVANDTKQKARKDHQCCACNEKIPSGFEYTKSFFVEDGPQSDKWHTECREEFARVSEPEGMDPYDTWESGLPDEVRKKYGLKLIEAES